MIQPSSVCTHRGVCALRIISPGAFTSPTCAQPFYDQAKRGHHGEQSVPNIASSLKEEPLTRQGAASLLLESQPFRCPPKCELGDARHKLMSAANTLCTSNPIHVIARYSAVSSIN
ncbi:hypothetical protein TRVL_04544 [Trypanosoma vivax]|uniref:Uncharacterized protein n=1 Tax=Trypanosoma vivax (strain Y486) TaxID=1055687 RepID=G0TY03_TRYVY|nr:hypothetical protein TRVL_04544 [Trypanosoma vivax]CCC48848.1 hypothetical protein, unlikely [Trypanosoma vivax Y486]